MISVHSQPRSAAAAERDQQAPFLAVQKKLRRQRLDALLVSQPENRRYVSGYTADDTSVAESAGFLLVPARGTPMLLTDFRYQLQAASEAGGFEVLLYRRGLLGLLKKLLANRRVKRLGFEGHSMLYSAATLLKKVLAGHGVEAVPVTGMVESLRLKKNREEIEKIQKAVQLNEKIFQEVYATLRPGQTERQVAFAVERAMHENGADGPAFETIVAGGPNGALPHAVPTDRALQKGEPVVIDMGTRLNGYCSDMTRTVVLGRPDDRTVELFRLVRKAQLAGMAAVRAGIACSRADKAARDIIRRAGLGSRFGHGLGHGVGLAVHEAPSLNRHSSKKLMEGMVVTVEPGVYLPGWGGIRLENMVVVKKNSCDNLNADTTFLDL